MSMPGSPTGKKVPQPLPTDSENEALLRGLTFLDSSIAKILEVTKDEVGSCLWPDRGGYSYFGTVKVTSYIVHVPKESL